MAMTRAKSALILLVDEKDFGKKQDRLNFANILREQLSGYGNALEDSDDPAILYEQGDRNWAEQKTLRPEEETLSGEAAGEVGAARVLPLRFKKQNQMGRNLPRVSPSSLEGKGKIRVADIVRIAPTHALNRGTIIHRFFEEVDFITESFKLDRQELIQIATAELTDHFPDKKDWIARQVDDFFEMLDTDAVRRSLSTVALKSGERLDLWKEKSFTLRHGGKLLNGIFDRVSVVYRKRVAVRASLTDYKTDQFSGAEPLRQRCEHYRPQIQAYRQALGQMLNLDQDAISAELLFVSQGVSVQI